MFDQENANERLSQTLVMIDYQPGAEWINAVQIYPSTYSINYPITINAQSMPTNLSGGLCGLTNKGNLATDTWIKEGNNVQSVDLRTCLVKPDDDVCIKYANYWRYIFMFFST